MHRTPDPAARTDMVRFVILRVLRHRGDAAESRRNIVPSCTHALVAFDIDQLTDINAHLSIWLIDCFEVQAKGMLALMMVRERFDPSLKKLRLLCLFE